MSLAHNQWNYRTLKDNGPSYQTVDEPSQCVNIISDKPLTCVTSVKRLFGTVVLRKSIVWESAMMSRKSSLSAILYYKINSSTFK